MRMDSKSFFASAFGLFALTVVILALARMVFFPFETIVFFLNLFQLSTSIFWIRKKLYFESLVSLWIVCTLVSCWWIYLILAWWLHIN